MPRAEYDEEWDRNECELDEKCDPDTFSPDEWMLDGYYDPDDEGFSYKPGWDDREPEVI